MVDNLRPSLALRALGLVGTTLLSLSAPAQIQEPGPANPAVKLTISLGDAVDGPNGQPLPPLSSTFGSLSYEKSALSGTLFSSSNSDLISLFKLLGSNVLRVGGNSTDTTLWSPSGLGQTPGHIASADVTAFAQFLNKTGWKVIYGINLANPNTTPALAADEVAKVTSILGSSLLGFELGNEPNDYVANKYFPSGWGVSDYTSLYESFASTILKATPSAHLIGPASSGGSAGISGWFQPFASAKIAGVNLLTQHYYRGSNTQTPTPTVENLVAYPDTVLEGDLASLQSDAAAAGLPYRLGETNSYSGGGLSGVSNAYASALWSLDHMFTSALYGAAGINFHGGGSTFYSPITDNGTSVTAVNPLFYGLKFFNLAGTGTLYKTTISSTTLNVSAYAIETSPGSYNVVIINKDVRENLSITFDFGQTVHGAVIPFLLTNTNNDISATSRTTIQGTTIATNGSVDYGEYYSLRYSGDSATCYVPPISAIILRIH